MDAPGHRNPPPLPPAPNGLARLASGPPLLLGQTMLALFLAPHLVLLSIREKPLIERAMLLVALIIVACCLVLGLGRSPGVTNRIAETAGWLGRQVGELRRANDGSLAWDYAADAPQTLHHDGFRVDFAPAGATFSFDNLQEGDRIGIWISPTKVRGWTTWLGQVSWSAFDARSERDWLNWNRWLPPGSTLPGDRFAPLAREWLPWLAPLLAFVFYLAQVVSIYLVFLTMFTVLPIILRRVRSPGEQRVALCVNLYCSIIPLIVATAYHLAAPHMLDFPTLFVLAFLGYLIWAYSRVRRFLAGTGR